MNRVTRGIVSLVLLLALAGLAGAPALGGELAATQTAVEMTAQDAVVGTGFWSKAACIGCVGAFGLAGGGTLAGVLILAAANPELSSACVGTCIMAFS